MKSKNSQSIAKSIILDGKYNEHCKPSLSFQRVKRPRISTDLAENDQERWRQARSANHIHVYCKI